MIEINDKRNCCGCGACSQICPVHCISMQPDAEGFAYPVVDTKKCISCDACRQVCPMLRTNTETSPEKDVYPVPKAFGGWAEDPQIREDSSSGGAFSVLAMEILSQGGIVYGAAMGTDLTVSHISAETPADLGRLRGSKYVQSKIGNVYSEIRSHLQNDRKVLFTGTPCQVAG